MEIVAGEPSGFDKVTVAAPPFTVVIVEPSACGADRLNSLGCVTKFSVSWSPCWIEPFSRIVPSNVQSVSAAGRRLDDHYGERRGGDGDLVESRWFTRNDLHSD
jgi:hypothetical protein